VIRNYNTIIEIKNESKVVFTEKYAITVLNAQGDKFSEAVCSYDKLSSINEFNALLYDASGKKIRSAKKRDIRDISATSSESLADDNRVKVHYFNYSNYPYTVEYELKQSTKAFFIFPPWIPVTDEYIGIEQSTLKVIMPAGYDMRYKIYNLPQPGISSGDGTKILDWKLSSFPAVISEPFSLPWQQITPCVLLAPSDASIQGYKGNLKSWNSMSTFLSQLNTGRDQLPENIKTKVHQLINGNLSTQEKIKIYIITCRIIQDI
jgi:hypothetical protein